MDPNQLIEMIVGTKEWFDSRVEQLESVIKVEDGTPIKFQGENGELVDLPEEIRAGFIAGIKLALEVFGDFPITIGSEPDEDSEDLD